MHLEMDNLQSIATLLAGGVVVTLDPHRRVIADGAVTVKAGRIIAIDERESVEAPKSGG
jgi:cytosine/adenosine deaminase-related metal-dependent hydrolase